MNKSCLYILSLLLIIAGCKHRSSAKRVTPQNDSLNKFLEIANNDTIGYKIRLDNAKKALFTVQQQPNDSMNRVHYFRVANRFWNISDFKNYKKIVDKIIINSINGNDSFSIAKAYEYLGDYYAKRFESEDAYLFYSKSEKLYRLQKNPRAGKVLLSKAVLQSYEKDYIGAEKSAISALKIFNKNTDDDLTFDANNILGIAYEALGDFNKSMQYYQKSLLIIEKNNIWPHKQAKASVLNNMGGLFQRRNEHVKALKYFNIALKQENLYTDYPLLYGAIKHNIANSEFRLKNYSHLPELYYQSIKIADSLNDIPTTIACKRMLSEYFAAIMDTVTSIKYIQSAQNLATTNKRPRDLLLIIQQLSKIAPKKSRSLLEKYIKLNDSLLLSERKIRNKFAGIEYETDNLIQQKKQLETERDQKDRKLITAISLFALAFSLLIVVYLLNRQRLKNRELKLIKQQHESSEEIYRLMLARQQQLDEGKQHEKKRIAKELHDGVMGRLTSIRLNLFVLGKKQDPETIQKALGHIDEIRDVEQEIRSIAYDLGKNAFDGQADFLTIVRSIFLAMENHSGTRFVLQADDTIDWQAIDGHTKMQLYRILQEALQNIVKYAQANEVTVSMQKETASLVIVVTDNGSGFDKKQAHKGFGLGNMKERAKGIGGKLKIQSELGKGTNIIVTIPFTSHE